MPSDERGGMAFAPAFEARKTPSRGGGLSFADNRMGEGVCRADRMAALASIAGTRMFALAMLQCGVMLQCGLCGAGDG